VVMPGVAHRQHRYLNNRAENSHQPTRERERRCVGSSPPGTRNALSRCTESLLRISDHDAICSPPPITADFVVRDFKSGTRVRGPLPSRKRRGASPRPSCSLTAARCRLHPPT
jgi:hypothetical protein